MTTAPPLDSLQAALAYRFTNPVLLQEALTHKSFINERKTTGGSHNERLEFVGDAVLSLVVSEQLAALLPQSSEGALSKHKARLVSESMLAHVARHLKVGDCLRLGRGEELSRGREKDSLLADALEALIAAVYLDGGLESSRRVVIGLLERELKQVVTQQHRPGEAGPDHDKIFEVEVAVNGKVVGRGTGRSKKEAEQSAAKQALHEA